MKEEQEKAGIPAEAVSLNDIVPVTKVVSPNAGDKPQPIGTASVSVASEKAKGTRYNPETKKVEPYYASGKPPAHGKRWEDMNKTSSKQAEKEDKESTKQAETNIKEATKNVEALKKESLAARK